MLRAALDIRGGDKKAALYDFIENTQFQNHFSPERSWSFVFCYIIWETVKNELSYDETIGNNDDLEKCFTICLTLLNKWYPGEVNLDDDIETKKDPIESITMTNFKQENIEYSLDVNCPHCSIKLKNIPTDKKRLVCESCHNLFLFIPPTTVTVPKDKIVIACPSCEKAQEIPSAKILRIICDSCGKSFFYYPKPY